MFGVSTKKEYPNARLNSAVAGKSAYFIAKESGFEVPERTNILLVPCETVGVDEPMSREKLSPVLAIYKVNDYKEGFEKFVDKQLTFKVCGVKTPKVSHGQILSAPASIVALNIFLKYSTSVLVESSAASST